MLFWFQFLKTKLHSSFKTLIQNISFFWSSSSVYTDINPSNMILEAETVKIYWSAPIFTDVVSYFAGAILAGRKTSPDKLIQSELIS